MKIKEQFAGDLEKQFGEYLDRNSIFHLIEVPKQPEHGDLAFPCYTLAGKMHRNPALIAQKAANELENNDYERVEAVGAYLNVFLNKQQTANDILKKIIQEKQNYGNSQGGLGEVVAIDMSSPNIAKPFSLGHLRSTVIGHSLALIAEKCGYKTVRINHLGDWGTQFGKLIAAYKKWGSEEKVKQNTIKELLALYIRFHEEVEHSPELEEEGRFWFKQLEEGDADALALWKWFRAASLQEFDEIYKLLGVSFDSTNGEAFFNDKMQRIVDILTEKELLTESEGAMVVDLSEDNLPPCLIKKSDGATLYATRDLAAAVYRKETYQFAKSIYVVGNEQNLHFQQLKAVLRKMDYSWWEDIRHVSFGMILKEGKKMSTRKGKVVLLEDILQEAIELAKTNIEEKNPGLADKQSVAETVGVGAVIFHDLKNHRHNDIDFSLEDMLRVEGETGPYVQYTFARACSLLRKGGYQPAAEELIGCDQEAWPVVKRLDAFPTVIHRAAELDDSSEIAKYVVDLAQAFNKYYAGTRILEEGKWKGQRLALTFAVSVVLKEGLRLLGIHAPEEM
ncbi:arginine--tRNA ligase [Sediminibacillus dalangtanensis]|uniref:Arginine--tRNA ligase n=1 Tax=Sediminibacillus dalangtanensis TaxID=2729421 RepID=A0ABX7VUS9_9BACI|nr:arginine--tRNA ligase [Sediminibacillus dalangtanensis]QTM98097.1 arginine--tRNA ligase [Sediminibacillus dalangtanensis]